MKKLLFGVLFLLGLGLIYFGLVHKNVVSIVPESKVEAEEIKIVNNWFPKLEDYKSSTSLDLTAQGAILVNYDTGEVIFAKNAKSHFPAASTVKIMTALVVMDTSKLTDVYTVSKKAAEIGEDSMGLSENEKVRLSELLYGLMLPSGNDAAVTIAEGTFGSEDAFVQVMNKKARELGLTDSKFINSSGLDVDDETQYSTAYDLATIARYTWEKHSQFRKIAATDYIFIEGTADHKAYELYNDTNLLTTYPGVKGIKPGFTWEAGYCLVTYAENEGVRLIGVVLNSQNRRAEMTHLLDLGFSKHGITVEHPGLDLL